jgi:hypothetical protein
MEETLRKKTGMVIYRHWIDLYGLITIDWRCAHADRMKDADRDGDDVECSEETVTTSGDAELAFEGSIGWITMGAMMSCVGIMISSSNNHK